MTPELNWCGQPIREGEGYGGRPENIPKPCTEQPALAAAKQHYCVITESHLAEVFGNGAYKLTRSEAAKLLEELTGAHRTTCYRALRLNGRFARHLYSDGTTLSWH
jgi:aminoglycoside phosphotransferase family enzyme